MTNAFIPLPTISDDEILARLAAVVAGSLRIDPARVTPDASLHDLGAESIDLVEITLDVEHAFTIRLPERTILALGTEAAGEGVLEHEGRLTALGAELLQARLPAAAHAAAIPGAPIDALAPVFLRVDVWVRMIRGLLESTPRQCAACGGRLVQGAPERVRCPGCGAEADVPSGDDIGRAWVARWLRARSA